MTRFIHTQLIFLTSLLISPVCTMAQDFDPWFEIDAIEFRGDEKTVQSLTTPQGAMSYFMDEAEAGNFERASKILNMRLADDSTSPEIQARKLHYLLDRELGVDWSDLPDRPDGMSEHQRSPGDPFAGVPRRSIEIGSLNIKGRDLEIRIERVKAGDNRVFWMIPPRSVQNITAMYEHFGPGPLADYIPEWAKEQLFGKTPLWAWIMLAFMLLGTVLLSKMVAWLVGRFLRKRKEEWSFDIARQVATPIGIFVATLTLYLVTRYSLALPKLVQTLLLVTVVIAITLAVMRLIGGFIDYVTSKREADLQKLSGAEGFDDQRILTLLSVGRRIAQFVLVLIALGIIIAQFQSLRVLGFSLMASAGVATVVLGIAAQPVLGNIVASIQIAISQSISIGDTLIYKDEWGYVEDITYTFVLLRIWDRRRVVIPLRHIVTHPFENWTIRDSHLIKPIHIHADFGIDVEAIREYFRKILKEDKDWDEKSEPEVQVIDLGEETVKIRALCSARDAATAWDMHCRLREKLLGFVYQMDGGKHLPHDRRIVERQPPYES